MMKPFQTVSPIDGTTVYEGALLESHQLAAVWEQAQRAQAEWCRLTLAERIALCHDWIEHLINQDNLALELTRQIGRPIHDSPGEIRGMQKRARFFLGSAQQALASIELTPQTREIRLEPVGLVMVIAPWNYPLLTAINALMPALISGNAVVLKHSLQTPMVGEAFARAMDKTDAPKGILQNVFLDHEQTNHCIQLGRFRVVNFTGSVQGGHALVRAGQDQLIRFNLELGGKDPAYVTEFADIDDAAEQLASGAFFNAGQSCCGIERIYVHQSVYTQFLEAFVSKSHLYVLGDPLDQNVRLGPVVSTQSAAHQRALLKDAKAKGAEIICANDSKTYATDCYIPWHILCQTNKSMHIETQEIFGPLVTVNVVKDDSHAIKLMNDSEYGLTASVWTQDKEQALHLSQEVKTGTYFVNNCDDLDPELAWTGIKNSGLGWSLSVLGFQTFIQPKSINMCKLP